MSKLRIKVINWGIFPFPFDEKKIENWKSNIFEICGEIETHRINIKSDGVYHEFSDKSILNDLPKPGECDFLVAITNVPLELNWFTRRIGVKTVIFTYSELNDLLEIRNIPLENLALRLLYSFSIIYKRFGNSFPLSSETTNFTHSDTRHCLFDFNGIKTDVIYSAVKPILCDECYSKLQKEKLSKNTLDQIRKELKKINKKPYTRIKEFIDEKPFLSIAISTISVIILGLISALIYDLYIKGFIN